MAKLLKLRRGTTTQHASFTGAEGEVTVDITKDTAVIHDGAQAGGRPLAREDMSNVSSASIAGRLGTDSIATTKIAAGALPSDVTVSSANIDDGSVILSKMANNSVDTDELVTGAITNVKVNASAAIAGTKISPDFGSQNIDTSGYIEVGSASSRFANNQLKFNSAGASYIDHSITGQNINFRVSNSSSLDTTPLILNSDGHVDVAGNLDVGAGIDVTGNMTVTGTVDGRDVAADGTKLDGIESGATADQTKSDIDGLNINADTVDGLHGSQFLRKDTSDTISGNLTVSGALTSTGTLTVMSGQTSSDIYMTDTDETTRRIHCNSSRVGFLQSNNAWGAYCDNSGNWVAAGNVTAYSDQRLKTDISTINDALGIVGKLRGVSYKWLKDGSDSIGVIAQEVEEVLPEVVVTGEGVNPVTQEIEEIKSVDYGKIVGVLINAINELKAEVDELKGGK